ncbi:TPA: hypothetical protein DHU97_03810 [Candidatus Saccharibacteria bacterium]|nr:hypothetical protein [Candidatus Saccharibacteria bacterium]
MKKRWFIATTSLLVGVLVVLGVRFVTYHPAERPHYHANFAVYINGQREAFKSLKYYEETAAAVCAAEPHEAKMTPLSRVHMHGMVSDVVHVEDELVTWGNFFAVLDWGVGDTYFSTGQDVYTTAGGKKLTFMVNGKKVDSITNRVIGDQDKVLINYGNQTPEQLQAEYKGIQNKAKDENNSSDPAGCGSNMGAPTMRDRFMHLL